MAKVTTKTADVVYVLELTKAEATYVVSALYLTDFMVDGKAASVDPVYGALVDAGLSRNPQAAALNGNTP